MAQESSTEKSFKRWCKQQGLWYVKLKLAVGKGWPDDAILLPNNVVCWVEMKAKNGKLEPHQEFCIAKMKKAGHEVVVARTLEEAISAVTQLSNRSKKLPT